MNIYIYIAPPCLYLSPFVFLQGVGEGGAAQVRRSNLNLKLLNEQYMNTKQQLE